jgi:hypothetical protein
MPCLRSCACVNSLLTLLGLAMVVSMVSIVAANQDDLSLEQVDAEAFEEAQGYDWEMERRHWAYRPIEHPSVPDVDDEAWCRNDIDRFVLASLESNGLAPAPQASRETLVRRLYFDLLGLPPTVQQVRRFIEDDSADAFERLVDELLESPHYGERWGRHWLDVTRYADSNGLDENTAFGNAWRYRDWVVRSFNDDLPYDRFVMEQLAGDLMNDQDDSDRSVERLLATGFLSLGPKVLAEPDKEKMQIDIVDEQLDVMGQALLGQTIGCARCHDHKFDPIPTADYYALAGIFYSTRTMESLNTVARVLERALATPEEVENVRRHEAGTDSNEQALEGIFEEGSRVLRERWIDRTSEIMLAVSRMKATPRIREAESFDDSNLNIDHDRWGSGVGVIHTVRPDELQFAEYVVNVPLAGRHRLVARFASAEERPLRLLLDGEVVTDAFCDFETDSYDVDSMEWDEVTFDLAAGRHVLRLEREASYPHLDRFFLIGPAQHELFARELDAVSSTTGFPSALLERWALALEGDSIFAPWREAVALNGADFSTASKVLMADLQSRYQDDSVPADGVEDVTGVTPGERVFLRSLISGAAPRDLLEFSARWQTAARNVVDDREHLLAETDVDTRAGSGAGPEALRNTLIGEHGIYAVNESNLDLFPEEFALRLKTLLAERTILQENKPPEFAMGIVVEDAQITDLPIFIRGNHTTKSDVLVPRGMLQIVSDTVPIPALEDGSSGRLELARWIIDPEHPLTSRVAVNRFWHWHFGRGLAPKPSNFGTRGGEPSHPLLLDWLARRFVAEGWSVKAMHRLILTSSAWRIGGTDDPESYRIDPENRLLGRRDPRRLEAEPIRDSLLAVTGSLDTEMGGSLLRSGNFAYVTNDQSASNEIYTSKRRALYLPLIRNDMYPFFSIFDYPDASVTVDARPSTMVAQQALFMMNSPLVVSQAERLASNLLAFEADDDEQRIVHLYLTCFARHPNPSQLASAIVFLERIRAGGPSGRSVSWPENSMESDQMDPELHAWRTLCHAMLASNEFIYLD